MGKGHSKDRHHHHGGGSTHHGKHSQHQHHLDSAPAVPPPPPALLAPKITGFHGAGSEASIPATEGHEGLVNLLMKELPYDCQHEWRLRFSSKVHGKSFTRFVDRVTSKGPTLIFIKEAAPHGAEGGGGGESGVVGASAPRIFGGFCNTAWMTVHDRDKIAKSHAAAKARAQRNGLDAPSDRPKNQAPQFFGDRRCFVFTSNTAQGSGPVVHHARDNLNSNFQYLFDTHPDEDRVGVGMGGKPNYHAWFLDKWLEQGHCRGSICTTFGNPALTPRENFVIDEVEVYSVDRESFKDEEIDEVVGAHRMSQKNTVLKNSTTANVDMMLLELNGTHQFRADMVADESDDEEDEEEESESDAQASPQVGPPPPPPPEGKKGLEDEKTTGGEAAEDEKKKDVEQMTEEVQHKEVGGADAVVAGGTSTTGIDGTTQQEHHHHQHHHHLHHHHQHDVDPNCCSYGPGA